MERTVRRLLQVRDGGGLGMAGGDGDPENWTDTVALIRYLVLCWTRRPPLNDRSYSNPLPLEHLKFPSQDEVKVPKYLFL